MPKSIAFFELEGWEEKIIRGAFPEYDVFLSLEKLHEYAGDRNDFEIISVFVNSEVKSEVIKKFPDLKLITTRSTGFDHIDLAFCKEQNITVAYVPGYGDNTVAEFAFALILNLTRKAYAAIDQVKETASFSFKGLRGMDLKGKTMGIIGTGRIGKESIRIAQGFGMRVIAFDAFPNEAYARENNFSYVELEELLKSSDVISIHAPLNETTYHLLNKGNISLIKHGAYLVNTARGGIVETDALVYALEKGILAGVGLDVLEEEGEIKDEMKFLKESPPSESIKTALENHILMRMPNVLITPHNAFNTQEALERILQTTFENIGGFISGTLVEKNIAK